MRSTFSFTMSRVFAAPAIVFALLLFGVPALSQEKATKQAVEVNDDLTDGMRVSPPVTYKNLAVYFIHSDTRDDQEYLTLNDGLKQGLVVVTEKKNEQVSELLINNKSDKPLFLQEGDRVTGGKQDRMIYSSLVIKPKSGVMPIPTFCVEQSRWTVGEKGKSFAHNVNPALASNAVRNASKLAKNQGEVWRQVGNSKAQLQLAIGNQDQTTSLNESLDSKKATESLKPFVDALKNASDKHDDLVGVAFAIDGHIQEINVYPGCSLAKQVYPRLLQTYALDAIVADHQRKNAGKEKPKPPTAGQTGSAAAQVAIPQNTQAQVSNPQFGNRLNFNPQVAMPQAAELVFAKPKPVQPTPSGEAVLVLMKTKVKAKADRSEQVNDDNRLVINQADKAVAGDQLYRCQTDYQKKPFHLQWVRAKSNSANAIDLNNQLQRAQNYTIRNQIDNGVQTDGSSRVEIPQQQGSPVRNRRDR